jgi:hypothetical protein
MYFTLYNTMITPRLTAVMVAMTALVGSGPIAAFAQLDLELNTGNADNDAFANTGANSIESVTVGNQEATNAIVVEQENEAENEGGDAVAIAEAETESESKNKDSKYSGNGGSSEAEAEAEGGDVENEQTNVAIVRDNEQEIEQEQEIESENSIETGDVEQDQTAQTGILNFRDIAIIADLLGNDMQF